jgi:hypothetical protein
MFKLTKYMIVLTLASSILVFHAITGNTQSLFAQIKRGIVISIANSSYVPLTNTDANQVRVNVKYTSEDDTLKNKKLNAVMKVTAPNGTLIRTTSIPNGFTAKSGGGIEGLKTTFHDKLMDKISANITLTDITKKTPLSNALTLTLNLKEAPTTASPTTASPPLSANKSSP